MRLDKSDLRVDIVRNLPIYASDGVNIREPDTLHCFITSAWTLSIMAK